MTIAERNDIIVTRVHAGESRKSIAEDMAISLPLICRVMKTWTVLQDDLKRERDAARVRRLFSHPCGIAKENWHTCYGQGCLDINKRKCTAYLNKTRRPMQILETECTQCGHEHEINDERLWRLGDTLMAACPECQTNTEHWIYNIIVPTDKKAAA